jgi:molybdopterin/thiamine biosynthesis adenylyltransferase
MKPLVTLVVPGPIAAELDRVARGDVESAATMLVGVGRTPRGLRLLARELHWVNEQDYERRTGDSMSIPPRGYLEALARAEEIGATPVFVHTHPGPVAVPHPSRWDDIVDEQLAETFRIRAASDLYASLIVSPASTGFCFTGRGIDGEDSFELHRVLVSAERLSLLTSFDRGHDEQVPVAFDRQVRAFGGDVQRVLSSLQVGVVGCGGTGSAVIEQLIRLGVRSLVLVDPDTVSESNLTRVYGSSPDDVGAPKVDVLARHARHIAPDADVQPIQGLVTSEAVARKLAGCDVLFGCTDDNAGRLVLTRLAAYYLTPLIDCGILISSNRGVVAGIDARVTVQTPGSACLLCRGRIDLARAAAEQLDPAERQVRQDEGYAPELGRVEPAVVTFTSMVASQAVTELLERLIGFGPESVPSEVIIRVHERETSTNIREPQDGHLCDPHAGMLGQGDVEPYLGQLWRSS